MSKHKRRLRNVTPEAAASIGYALFKLDNVVKQIDPTKQTIVRSVTIKFDGWDYFLVLRGSYGGLGVVQFARLETLAGFPSQVAEMIANGSWQTDKFG